MTIPHHLVLLKRAAVAWNDDDASSMGAALAYYTLFAIAPLLVMVVAVAGLLFGRDAAQNHILGQLRNLTGDAGVLAIEQLLRGAQNTTTSLVAELLGTAILLFGTTSVFAELYGDLNRIWRSPSAPKASGIVHLVRTRILSFGMILGIGFLLIVSLVVSAGLAAAGEWFGSRFTVWNVVMEMVDAIFNIGTITVAFAMIYKFLPRAAIAWRDVWIGALMTAILFEIGRFLIGVYLGRTYIASGFGAAGSLAIFLVWIYYSAQIFLLGAEFTWVYAYRDGSRVGETPPDPPPPRGGRPVTAAAGANAPRGRHHRKKGTPAS
ncbi:MAG: YihY/virulence factor BrkB family protein [Gemmatimonadales bacterium]